MRRPWLILLSVGFLACRASVSRSVPAGESAPSPPAARLSEVWVDGGRTASGDGSRASPWRTLGEALAAPGPVWVHVARGLYAGPFTLPAGTRLEGTGATTVLYTDGVETAVRAPGGAELVRLAVQGGGWGLEGAGTVKLEGVAFSGQRTGAVRLGGGRLVAAASHFEAGVSETEGLVLEGPARGEVKDSTLSGPYRRGVSVKGGAEAVLESVRSEGPVTAVQQEGGRTELRRVSAEGGRGPALWVQDGAMKLEGVSVTGHEFGLSAHGAELEVRGFTSVRAEQAGLALVESRGRLEDVEVRGSGRFGALQLVGSDLTLRHVRVDGADAYGVQATNGRLRASDVTITRLRSSEHLFGDGLHLRGVVAEVEGLVVRDVEGAGVLAAQGAEVTLRDATLVGCRQAGVAVETLGAVNAERLEVRDSGGPALAVLRDGTLRADALTAKGNAEGLLWAECEGETQVHLGRLQTEDKRGLEAPCVTLAEAARPRHSAPPEPPPR